MFQFKTARELAVYIRDEMDKFRGRELSKEFKAEFIAFCYDGKSRKQIFRGEDFSATFITVLREDRLQLLRKVLKDEGFKD